RRASRIRPRKGTFPLRHRLCLILIVLALVGAAARPAAGCKTQANQKPSTSSPSSSAPSFAEAKRAEIARYAAKLQSADKEQRREAALMLSAMRDPETTEALKKALADQSERVRAAALAGLGMLYDASLVSVIASSLAADKSPFVRKTAAYGLGQLGR